MASRIHKTDDQSDDMAMDAMAMDAMGMRKEEQARVHEAYSRLGRMGGEKGGQIRREQMARGEIFTREARSRLDQSPGEERNQERR